MIGPTQRILEPGHNHRAKILLNPWLLPPRLMLFLQTCRKIGPGWGHHRLSGEQDFLDY